MERTPGRRRAVCRLPKGRALGRRLRGATVQTHRPSEAAHRSEEHTSELQSHSDLVCRLLLEKKNYKIQRTINASLNAATSTRAVSSNPNVDTRQKIAIIFG